MNNNGYLNFSEAVEFLNTTRSTMYKWLQAGKVPAHKLGRQWRFLEKELSTFRSNGEIPSDQINKKNTLEVFLKNRLKKIEEFKMQKYKSTNELAESLIWDAVISNHHGIHLQPKGKDYEVRYRAVGPTNKVVEIDKKTFTEINDYIQSVSEPTSGENNRRFFINKDINGKEMKLHLRYQLVKTVIGDRVNIAIDRSDIAIGELKDIAKGDNLKKLKKWLNSSHGIIIFSGPTGCGKTTTIHYSIQELLEKGLIVFTIEEQVNFILDGVNQIEVGQRSNSSLEDCYKEIENSDFDVLVLGLSDISNIKNQLELAEKASKSGHLVLIQMDKSSREEIDNTFSKLGKENLGNQLVGVSCQEIKKIKNKFEIKFSLSE